MFKNLSTEALGVSGTQNETIELALSHGFRGIDLDVADFSRQVQSRGLPHTRRLIDSAKLKLGSFELPLDLEQDETEYLVAMQQLPALAALAAELGCLRAVATIAPASQFRPYHQNFEHYRKRLGDVADVLDRHSIRLGVGFLAAAERREGKPFQFIHQFDALLMLLALVGRKNVGIALDLWNLIVAGGSVDDLRKLSIDQVVTVQLADLPAEADLSTVSETARLLPGEGGVIDSAAVLVWLAEQAYDGPVTPWPNRNLFSGMRRDEIGRRAGQALDEVWKAAGLSPSGKLTVARK